MLSKQWAVRAERDPLPGRLIPRKIPRHIRHARFVLRSKAGGRTAIHKHQPVRLREEHRIMHTPHKSSVAPSRPLPSFHSPRRPSWLPSPASRLCPNRPGRHHRPRAGPHRGRRRQRARHARQHRYRACTLETNTDSSGNYVFSPAQDRSLQGDSQLRPASPPPPRRTSRSTSRSAPPSMSS